MLFFFIFHSVCEWVVSIRRSYPALSVLSPQETPSWLCRSSNGTSCCPQQSRGSLQTPARNRSSPSNCPHPLHKCSANEPPPLPLTPELHTHTNTSHNPIYEAASPQHQEPKEMETWLWLMSEEFCSMNWDQLTFYFHLTKEPVCCLSN